MNRRQRRILWYVTLVVAVVVGYTLVYHWGMATLEGRPRSLIHSLQVVVETFTTVGYGEDAPWTSNAMVGLMILMQFTGVFLVFLALPMFLIPWLERRLAVEPPVAVERANHVVICRYSSRGEALVDELVSAGVEYVIVEPDRETARELHETGHVVVHGDPESTEVLRNASVPTAAAVVMDASDETNATIALSVRELAPDVRVVGFVEDPRLTEYLHYAGADQVLSPRDLLGRSLADKVTSAITARLGETVEIGDDFEIVELPVQPDSELDGVRLADSGIRERTGVNIIGAWDAGEFTGPPAPDRVIDRDTILLVAGEPAQLSALKDLTLSEERRHDRDHVVVAGYGEVGTTVRQVLDATGIRTTVVDREALPDVDVVGDVTDEETLIEAGVGEASALILALGDDTATIFATLVARQLDEDVEIVCRANGTESVPKLYNAGADYVLALATVSGRMLAETILGEEVMSLDAQVEIVRAAAPGLVGETVGGARIRSRTGCTVIAVERDGTVLTEVGPDFRVQQGDALVVAGRDQDITRFNDLAGVAAGPA